MCDSNSYLLSENLIKVAGEQYVNSGQLPQEILHSLFLVHGKNLQAALGFIDKEKISVMRCPSGRWIIVVTGNSGLDYILLPNAKLCQCYSFKFSILRKKEQLMCKHILAAKLAISMNVAITKNITDDELVDHLLKY